MRKIDDIYKSLGLGIINNLPDKNFESAWINAEVLEDAGGFDGEYIVTGSNEKKYFEVDDNAYLDFEELHKITESDKNRWNKAKFTLFPSGKFNIDFEWDQDMADEIEALSKE